MINAMKAQINQQRCKSCGICIAFCPKHALGPVPPLNKAAMVNMDLCIGCGMCELYCPDMAIGMLEETHEQQE